ncbi:hypothetical protein K1719_038810 [Acacia pycnantha]|nr:hypothetical protein K1719_038810 [Acacia pycnantha]
MSCWAFYLEEDDDDDLTISTSFKPSASVVPLSLLSALQHSSILAWRCELSHTKGKFQAAFWTAVVLTMAGRD